MQKNANLDQQSNLNIINNKLKLLRRKSNLHICQAGTIKCLYMNNYYYQNS